VNVGLSAVATSVPTGLLDAESQDTKRKTVEIYSQTRVKATIFVSAGTSERRLCHGVVLGVEVVDNLVTGICELEASSAAENRRL
jgi:hypothetical protein